MSVGDMAISGLVASNIDIEGIITQLGQIRRRPVQRLELEQERYTERLSAFQKLTANTLNLSAHASALTDGSAFSQVTATSSNESAVVVSASDGAPVGDYQVVVDQLASSHKIASGSLATRNEALGHEGEIILNGTVVTLEASDSLTDLRDRINAAGAGVSASILTVSESDHRLMVSSLTSGVDGAVNLIDANDSGVLEALGIQHGETSVRHEITDGAASNTFSDRFMAAGEALGLALAPAGTVQINGAEVTVDLSTDSLDEIAATISEIEGVNASVENVVVDNRTMYRLDIVGDDGRPAFTDDANVLATLGVLEKGLAHEMDEARDAVFSINGVSMTRSSNAVDNAIENVQLQLTGTTDPGGATVRVMGNPGAAVDAVQETVDAYNGIVELINKHMEFDTEKEKGGLFSGSTAIVRLESDLRRCLSELVDTLGGNLTLGSQVGLRFNRNDELVFDSDVFLDALQSDPEGVRRLFGSRAEASGAGLSVESYSSATLDSGPDGWAVNITQPATRATATSADLSDGIVVSEMLTINGRSVGLNAGMSLQEATDRINSLFNTQRLDLTASAQDGRIVIEHESFGSREITIASSLDADAGGTGLGGAVAGESAVYEGRDVEGTIGGEAATGRGRLLIAGRDTEAEGLEVLVSAESAGEAGVVRVSKGIASRLTDFIGRVTDPRAGYLTRAVDGVTNDIAAIDDQIAEVEADVDRYIEQQRVAFARMESQMSQSIALLDWMENQIQHLSGWNDRGR